ncbi:MAG: SRPBCC family protein [Flavobacteriales bacterium]|nr:SRPBCC family protein [Flavobacteriales bacterium]
MTAAKLEGPAEEGSTFRWKAGGLRFTSRIHTAEAMTRFGWTGRTIGASAIHNWRFEPRDGGTLVQVEESLQGFFPTLFRPTFQRQLEAGIRTNLEELKQAVEKRGG